MSNEIEWLVPVNGGVVTIREALEQKVNSDSLIAATVLDYFVLRNGQPFTPVAHTYKMGRAKECFMNAAHFSMDNPGWHYVEGFAVRRNFGIMIHHAWVADDNGTAVDLTWADSEGCDYYGVVFDQETLTQQLLANKVYGLLDIGMFNIDLMVQLDPTVQTYLDEQMAKRNAHRERLNKIMPNK